MKILLINPSQKMVYGIDRPQVYPPLGLLYIGSVLERMKHKVRLLDLDAEGLLTQELPEFLKNFSPDVVGLSFSTAMFNQALLVAKVVKETLPVPVVVGGIHPTIDFQSCISNKDIDFVVIGEGEITIQELISRMESGQRDFSDIRGLCFRKNGQIIRTPNRELIGDLDTVPFPARRLLKNPEAYVPADARRAPVAAVITSRGCPGRCTYCCTAQIFGKRFRARSVENILAEIEELIREYGVKEIHIADDVFTLNKRRALKFCQEVKKRNLDLTFVFFNGLRADQVDREILNALKEIGVISVGYGVESGNNRILKNIKKDIDLETFRRVYKMSREMGFQTWAFFMFGLPGESTETTRHTINFAKELDPDFAKFLILKPFPGSPIFEDLSSQGLITDFNYDHYGVYTPPVHHLPNLSAEEILFWQRRAYREFYLRPRIIWKHIRRIKSWSQLKFDIKSLFFVLEKMRK